MEPRVSKREKKLHLSYELPHRIHCSQIYPLRAPDGSSIILYGHDRGLRVLWRGGRRLKETSSSAPAQANGFGESHDVIVTDDDEPSTDHQKEETDEYEADEDEQDADCPYLSIIQDVEIELDTEILQLATPLLSSSKTLDLPAIANTHMAITLACADKRVLLLTIPLAPPKSTDKQQFIENAFAAIKELDGGPGIAQDVAMKVLPRSEDQTALAQTRSRGDVESEGRLVVAAAGAALNVWELKVTATAIGPSEQSQLPLMHSTVGGATIAFSPSPRSTQLLLADKAGVVRLYDVYAPRTPIQGPPSRESTSSTANTSIEVGRWTVAFHTPFHAPKASPMLSRRKQILDAAWVLGGRVIMVLLEDGEWGMWDLLGSPQAGKSIEDFVLRGFLGSLRASEVAESGLQKKKGASKLAPMTPNTRKAKSENLFSGTPRAPGAAANGGISVAATSARSGQTDENMVVWYNDDVYSITSVQSFWQRSTSNAGGFGSLYAPGLTHVSDIDLMSENITSISQFTSKAKSASLGQINTPRDLLICAEHRFLILQSMRAPVPTKELFEQATQWPTSRDQQMLDAGELDIGGMDRMLDSIADNSRARRVGFAR